MHSGVVILGVVVVEVGILMLVLVVLVVLQILRELQPLQPLREVRVVGLLFAALGELLGVVVEGAEGRGRGVGLVERVGLWERRRGRDGHVLQTVRLDGVVVEPGTVAGLPLEAAEHAELGCAAAVRC